MVWYVVEQANQCVNQTTMTHTALKMEQEHGYYGLPPYESLWSLLLTSQVTDIQAGWVTDLLASYGQSGTKSSPSLTPPLSKMVALICNSSISPILFST